MAAACGLFILAGCAHQPTWEQYRQALVNQCRAYGFRDADIPACVMKLDIAYRQSQQIDAINREQAGREIAR